ncbi:MAG: hypothetical protein MJZ09_10010 [Bacteroidales bacterium]|nr:hypothetical protein [Bacteroidales bacterium]
MKEFYHFDSVSEREFASCGRWWHLYTPGNETCAFLLTRDDFVYAMNLLARCVEEVDGIIVIAFELMNNHLHLVAAGEEDALRNLFERFRRRLSRYLSSMVGRSLPKEFCLCMKEIHDLKSLRNVIAYTHRNGYVVNPAVTPFSYPWGTGRYYYNDVLLHCHLGDYDDRAVRAMFKGRNPHLPNSFLMEDGYVAPPSFCDISKGMSLFKNAHQYFQMLSRDVEAYMEMAMELSDSEFLTDSELFGKVISILNKKYSVRSVSELSKEQTMQVARDLHYDFKASNGQIRRILHLSQAEVDSLFPLSAQK